LSLPQIIGDITFYNKDQLIQWIKNQCKSKWLIFKGE
jgi:hypothetical protein